MAPLSPRVTRLKARAFHHPRGGVMQETLSGCNLLGMPTDSRGTIAPLAAIVVTISLVVLSPKQRDVRAWLTC